LLGSVHECDTQLLFDGRLGSASQLERFLDREPATGLPGSGGFRGGERLLRAVAAWKQVFDSDPVGGEKVGVRRYQVLRAIDDPNLVMIDLDFDSAAGAEAFLVTMRRIWGQVEGTLINPPTSRIVESVETKEY
jgi:hypothetical protein